MKMFIRILYIFGLFSLYYINIVCYNKVKEYEMDEANYYSNLEKAYNLGCLENTIDSRSCLPNRKKYIEDLKKILGDK